MEKRYKWIFVWTHSEMKGIGWLWSTFWHSSVQEAFSSLHIRILSSPQTPLNILRAGDNRGAHQGERQSRVHESASTASNSSISAQVSIDDDDDADDFFRPEPCMTINEALLAWAKNLKRFEKGGDRWHKMIAELEQRELWSRTLTCIISPNNFPTYLGHLIKLFYIEPLRFSP